ncbi:MAG: VWA domain-containing protein [Bacteroidota bacterium]
MKNNQPKNTFRSLKVLNVYFYIIVVSIAVLLLSLWSCNPSNNTFIAQGDFIEDISLADIDTEETNTEEYDRIQENAFKKTNENPFSTFSIDVDHASYSNVRRFINHSELPPKDAVRIEEMVNYFTYDYPEPEGPHPFTVIAEIGVCPWNTENRLIHIGIQGKRLDYTNLKPSNLTFLIDVSGSMDSPQKLPLVKKSIKILLNRLNRHDRVSIVVYAGSAGVVLPATPANEKDKIISALNSLRAGGSTAGGEGIRLAYEENKKTLMEGGNNRVILVTDGDFNVGVSSTGALVDLIQKYRLGGTYLTICGFGMGNYKDNRLEQISNAGNGNYFYIDNIQEAGKIFSREMTANLFTIAKDVKIQVEFNPQKVDAYRLIGYENRILAQEDFNNDKKDAGELGAGHSVTALYEIVPAGTSQIVASSDPPRYQEITETPYAEGDELMQLKLRYKPVESNESLLIRQVITANDGKIALTSKNFQFSAAVAAFGMLLQNSPHKGQSSFEQVITWANNASEPHDTDRQEFIRMVRSASLLSQ